MKKKRFIIFIFTLLIGLTIGNVTAFAYALWYPYGFSPTPAYITCYSGFSSATKTLVNNACLQWNSTYLGNKVYRTTADHTNTSYPLKNGANQITSGDRGPNTYAMQTYAVSTSILGTYIYEADIDINTNLKWSDSSSCPYDALDIGDCITHEIGHLLGLAHSQAVNPKATMTEPAVYGGTERRTIEQDDKNGIVYIYGQ